MLAKYSSLALVAPSFFGGHASVGAARWRLPVCGVSWGSSWHPEAVAAPGSLQHQQMLYCLLSNGVGFFLSDCVKFPFGLSAENKTETTPIPHCVY